MDVAKVAGSISAACSSTSRGDRPDGGLLEGLQISADTALKAAAALWFLAAVIGQWMFAVYILAFYGRAVVEHDLARWSKGLSRGYIPGDSIGNFALAMHLLLGVIITVGGPLQLIPQLRARLPSFHRWNGRIYMLATFTISVTALYLVWIRGGTVGGLVEHVAISLNAVLIMFCGAMALRCALARKFGAHRRWALRLFLVVSGVWFFRVTLMFGIIVNRSLAGFNANTFQGPFHNFLSFAQYLAGAPAATAAVNVAAGVLPLVILEIYLRIQDRTGSPHKFAMAAGLFGLTVAMSIGIFGAVMLMWLPRM
jgi:hypothetical protein